MLKPRNVSGGHGSEQTQGSLHSVWLGNVLHKHVFDLALNISRLVANGDLGQTRQVHKSQREHVRRENSQIDRERRNARILSSLELSVFDDFRTNLVKVYKTIDIECVRGLTRAL
jgi:hypothetical protein